MSEKGSRFIRQKAQSHTSKAEHIFVATFLSILFFHFFSSFSFSFSFKFKAPMEKEKLPIFGAPKEATGNGNGIVTLGTNKFSPN